MDPIVVIVTLALGVLVGFITSKPGKENHETHRNRSDHTDRTARRSHR